MVEADKVFLQKLIDCAVNCPHGTAEFIRHFRTRMRKPDQFGSAVYPAVFVRQKVEQPGSVVEEKIVPFKLGLGNQLPDYHLRSYEECVRVFFDPCDIITGGQY